MADSTDPMHRYAVLFGRAFLVTFGAMMAFDVVLAAGLSLILDAHISLVHGALRALEVAIPVGLGYTALRAMQGEPSQKDSTPWIRMSGGAVIEPEATTPADEAGGLTPPATAGASDGRQAA